MAASNPCEQCGGKCCRHIALEIDKPESRKEYDQIRWYLSHHGVQVFVEDGKWFLQVYTRCRYLNDDAKCANYARRPGICRSYQTSNCEGTTFDFDYEVHLKSDADLEAWLAQGGVRREA